MAQRNMSDVSDGEIVEDDAEDDLFSEISSAEDSAGYNDEQDDYFEKLKTTLNSRKLELELENSLGECLKHENFVTFVSNFILFRTKSLTMERKTNIQQIIASNSIQSQRRGKRD
jgi:hypothetical protein